MPVQQGIIGNILNPISETEVQLKLEETEADIKTPLLNLKTNANSSKSASPLKDCANGEMTTEEDALITTEETM